MTRRQFLMAGPAVILMMIFAIATALADTAITITPNLRIIDGDSFEENGEHLRLAGIDAFESSQTCTKGGEEYACGQAATEALTEMFSQGGTCLNNGRGRYGRIIVRCYVGDLDVNAELVRRGWALAYRKYSTIYVPQEDEARRQRRGAWAGEFVAPWDHRRAQRQ